MTLFFSIALCNFLLPQLHIASTSGPLLLETITDPMVILVLLFVVLVLTVVFHPDPRVRRRAAIAIRWLIRFVRALSRPARRLPGDLKFRGPRK